MCTRATSAALVFMSRTWAETALSIADNFLHSSIGYGVRKTATRPPPIGAPRQRAQQPKPKFSVDDAHNDILLRKRA